jgi:hypothetical protein
MNAGHVGAVHFALMENGKENVKSVEDLKFARITN